MNRSLLAAAFAACALAGTAQAQDADDGVFAARNFTATAILTSDYRFRGISNSDGFAFPGSLDWTHKGFNAGMFSSNTVFIRQQHRDRPVRRLLVGVAGP